MSSSSNRDASLVEYARRVSITEDKQKQREIDLQKKTAAQIEKQLFELGLLSKEDGDCIKWEYDFYGEKKIPRVVLKMKLENATQIG